MPSSKNKNLAIIGSFDGIHRGHDHLFANAKKIATTKKLNLILITFWPIPKIFFGIRYYFLTTKLEKQELLKKYNFKKIVFLQFNKKLSNITVDEFHKMLKKYNVTDIVAGEDFRYGKHAAGTLDSLKRDFNVFLTSTKNYKNSKISSSEIIKNIQHTQFIKDSNKMLGWEYFINGKVIHGDKSGRKIGFPTINLKIDEDKAIPSNGVYIGTCVIEDKKYPCAISIGVTPTLNLKKEPVVEAHILNFEKEIYDQNVKLIFHEWIRPEKKFSSVKSLIKAINNDVNKVKKYFNK